MASIAKFAIMFTANASGVEAGVNRAEKSLRGLSVAAAASNGRMGALGGGIARVVTGLGGLAAGVLSVNALKNSFTGAIDRLDDLGDKASGLQETAERLSQIEYVSVRSGSNAEAAAAGVEMLTRNLGQAVTEGGDLANMFQSLGLDVQEMSKQTPIENFIQSIQAIGELGTVYEKAAASKALFGRGAKALAPLIENPDDIATFIEDFDMLHGNVALAAEEAGKAKDQFDRLKEAVDGVGESMVIAFGPRVTGLVEALANKLGELNNSTGTDGESAGSAWVKGFFGSIDDTFRKVAKASSPALFGFMNDAFAGDAMNKVAVPSKAALDLIKGDKTNAGLIRMGKEPILPAELTAKEERAKRLEDASLRGEKRAQQTYETTTSAIRAAEARERFLNKSISSGSYVAPAEVVSDAVEIGGQSLGELLDMDEVEADITKLRESIIKDIETPLDVLNDRLEKIAKVYQAGQLSEEENQRAIAAARKDYVSSLERMAKGTDATGGDQPGMMGGIDPALQRMIDFSMPAGGFVGGVMPTNFRLFSPPGDGSRQTIMASDVLDSAGVPYFDQQMGEDPQLADANRYLQQIAQNTAVPQAVY